MRVQQAHLGVRGGPGAGRPGGGGGGTSRLACASCAAELSADTISGTCVHHVDSRSHPLSVLLFRCLRDDYVSIMWCCAVSEC